MGFVPMDRQDGSRPRKAPRLQLEALQVRNDRLEAEAVQLRRDQARLLEVVQTMLGDQPATRLPTIGGPTASPSSVVFPEQDHDDEDIEHDIEADIEDDEQISLVVRGTAAVVHDSTAQCATDATCRVIPELNCTRERASPSPGTRPNHKRRRGSDELMTTLNYVAGVRRFLSDRRNERRAGLRIDTQASAGYSRWQHCNDPVQNVGDQLERVRIETSSVVTIQNPSAG